MLCPQNADRCPCQGARALAVPVNWLCVPFGRKRHIGPLRCLHATQGKTRFVNMCDDVRVTTVCPDYLVYRGVVIPTIEPALNEHSLLCLHIWARRSRRRKRLLSRTTYIWCFTSAYLPLHHISHLRSHTRKLL